jgi:hypothetical protein
MILIPSKISAHSPPSFFVFVPAVFPVLWEALGRRVAVYLLEE